MRLKRKEKGDQRRRMNIFGEVSKCTERRLTTPGSEAKGRRAAEAERGSSPPTPQS
jgi:hypothetical protein